MECINICNILCVIVLILIIIFSIIYHNENIDNYHVERFNDHYL